MDKINLKTKQAETVRKQLAQKNKAFAKLPRNEQRIAIAKDVIAQIRAKKFVAASTYFQLGRSDAACDPYSTPEYDLSDNVNSDLSECVAKEGCTVCGIGSLFASAVLNNDKLKVKKVSYLDEFTWEDDIVSLNIERDDEVHYLRKWFDADQLDLIERYFERNYRSWTISSPILDEDDASKRLIMIMKNIVANGKFDPTKGPHKNSGE